MGRTGPSILSFQGLPHVQWRSHTVLVEILSSLSLAIAQRQPAKEMTHVEWELDWLRSMLQGAK